MTTPADHDDEPLDVGKLAAERFEQRLRLVRSELLETAGQNGKFLSPDDFEYLVGKAADAGVAKDQSEPYLRRLIQENGIHLSMPETSFSAPDAPPAENQEPKPAAAAVAPARGKWCPQCSQEASAEDQFCGKCALPLRCPRCGRDYQLGNRFCAACRLDPVLYRQFQEQAEAGRRLFQGARCQGPPPGRLQLAEQASQAFAGALQCYPASLQVQSLAAEARRYTKALLWEVSEAARRDRQLSSAISLLQRLALDPAETVRANVQLQELYAQRNRWLADARGETAGGRWDRAVQILIEARQSFPEDPEISSLLAEYQQNTTLVQDAIKNQIPQLQQAKQFVALLRLLSDLETKELHLGWLTGALDTCQKRVRRAGELAAGAERLLEEPRPHEALTEAERALEVAADHELALQIKARVEEGFRRRQGWEAQLDTALKAQRWFLADRALAHLNPGDGNPGLAEQGVRIRAGLSRANDFLRLVAWTLFGGLSLLLAARIALVLKTKLADTLPDKLFGAALGAFAFLVLAFLLACFHRPLSLQAVGRGFATVLALAVPWDLVWSVLPSPLSSVSLSPGVRFLCLVGSLGLLAVLGAVLGGLFVALAGKILPLPAGWFSPLHRQAILAGAAGTCLCGVGLADPTLLLVDVPVAVLLFGLLALAGNEVPGQFYLLALAALLSSGVREAATTVGLSPTHWFSWTVTWALLASAGFFVSRDRRIPSDLVRAGLLAAVALAVSRLLAPAPEACVLVSVWVLVCGTIARVRFSAPDHRLHLLDRFQAWSGLRSA